MNYANGQKAGDINHLPKVLPEIINRSANVFTDLPNPFQPRTAFSRYLSGLDTSRMKGFPKTLLEAEKTHVKPLRPIMNELRVFKSEDEIRNMRKAGQASGRAFTEAMRNQFSGEKELGAFLDYRFKMHGCDGPAYVPVIAGGEVSTAFADGMGSTLTVSECAEHPLCAERCSSQVRV